MRSRARAFMGSVAEAVVRTSGVPVAVVRAPQAAREE
jgi:nucleotide-binding universal stress UspA family protein